MISIFLASILCAGAPLAAENDQTATTSTVQTVSNSFELGSSVVEKVRADYKSGHYNEFLKEMDNDYNDAKADGGLEGLIELHKETGKVKIHPEFIRSEGTIQASKNENLLSAAGSDNSVFAQKVRSAASSVTGEGQLLNSLHYQAPGSGDNQDENSVIDIDLAYTYKSIHASSLAASGDSIPDLREKLMVLQMDRMDRLATASQSFQDKDLKKAIDQASSSLDQRLAKIYDMKDILDLGAGRIKPLSPLEEKAASIVENSKGQLAEMHRHFLNNLDNQDPIAETVQK